MRLSKTTIALAKDLGFSLSFKEKTKTVTVRIPGTRKSIVSYQFIENKQRMVKKTKNCDLLLPMILPSHVAFRAVLMHIFDWATTPKCNHL